MYQLGERIRGTRKKSSITQKPLSDMLGIKAATFSRYENNEIEPPITNLCKIASALRVEEQCALIGRIVEEFIK